MLRECPVKYECNGETDSPYMNLSSESVDGISFRARSWGKWTNLNPLGRDPLNPQNPNTNVFWANNCFTQCISFVSLQDAILCAQRGAEICTSTPPPDEPPTGPPFPELELFYNVEKSCTAPCPEGEGYTFTTPAGTFVALNQILADEMAYNYACYMAQTYRVCDGGGGGGGVYPVISALSPNYGCLNTFFNGAVTVSGGVSPYTWEIVGGFPIGFVGVSTPGGGTFYIQGMPLIYGSYVFQMKVTDAMGHSTTVTRTLNVMAITNATLPDLVEGVAYSAQLTAAGGSGSYTFTITSGTLPDGLFMNDAGELFGTPTTDEGDYDITFEVDDGISKCQQVLTIHGYGCFLDDKELPDGNTCCLYTHNLTLNPLLQPDVDYSLAVNLKPGDTLPDGLSMDGYGAITGTPTVAGTFTFEICVDQYYSGGGGNGGNGGV